VLAHERFKVLRRCEVGAHVGSPRSDFRMLPKFHARA
jgi:hypothetical protein